MTSKNQTKKPYLKVINSEEASDNILHSDIIPLEVLAQFEDSDMAENEIIANIEPF